MRTLGTIALMTLAATTAARAQDLPANEVRIEQLQYRGTGCAQGTVALNLSPDAQALTMLFADYVVDTSARDGRPARKSCKIDLAMSAPSGWTFALLGTQVRGYVSLERGAIATQRTLATLDRAPRQLDMGTLTVEGAFSGDYENFQEQPFSTLSWAPCGQSSATRLSLDTFISVRPKMGFRDDQGETDTPSLGRNLPKGVITVDSIDGSIDHLYTFAWKRCDDTGTPQDREMTATCVLKLANRQIRDSATNAAPERARAEAVAKVLNSCRLATQGRPVMAAKCQERRVACGLVQKRNGRGGGQGGGHGGGGPRPR